MLSDCPEYVLNIHFSGISDWAALFFLGGGRLFDKKGLGCFV
jgi:hypothetical protein